MTNRRFFIKALAVLPIVIAVGCGEKPTNNKLPSGAKVVALGDSLTFGYGADKGRAYPDVLAQKTGWQIDNMGVNGDTSQNVLDRLDVVVNAKPDLVLLGVGGNDVLRRVQPAITEENLTQIITRLQQNDIQVILIAEPHFSASALFGKASDNPVYEKVAKSTNIPLFAKAWSAILSDEKLKSDQIHANNAGYAKFADELYQFLGELGYV